MIYALHDVKQAKTDDEVWTILRTTIDLDWPFPWPTQKQVMAMAMERFPRCARTLRAILVGDSEIDDDFLYSIGRAIKNQCPVIVHRRRRRGYPDQE